MRLLVRSSRFWMSVLIFVLSCLITLVAEMNIGVIFPKRPVNADMAFLLLPRIDFFQTVADLTAFAVYGVFFWYALRKRKQQLPLFITALGIMYGLRAFMILLTPMGSPLGGEYLGLFASAKMEGYFPSGHTGCVFLMFLYTDQRSRLVRWFLGAMLALMIGSLLLGRGHYSIDIVGGLMLSYCIVSWLRPREQRWTVGNEAKN